MSILKHISNTVSKIVENTNERCATPPGRRGSRFGALQVQLLEARELLDGMSLVGNWHEQPGHTYADGWAEGNYAYIGHYNNQAGVDIIDISDPANPTQVANFKGNADNEIRDIEVQNGIGFFSSDNFNGGVYLVDLSDPTNPVQLGRISPANGGFSHVHTLSVNGDYLYEVDSSTSGIRVFNISDPANPTFLRTITGPFSGAVHEVTALNGRLYSAVIFGTSRADIFDISNVGDLGTEVPLLGTAFPGDSVHTVWPTEDGNYMVTARETTGGDVKIWDIHDPSSPILASTITVPTSQAISAHQPMIVGNLLYVAWYQAGLRVYDISDPYNPAFIADYKTYSGPVSGFAGCWGVYPFLGQNKILAFDIQTGLYILSLDVRNSGPSHGNRGAGEVVPISQLLSLATENSNHAHDSGGVRGSMKNSSFTSPGSEFYGSASATQAPANSGIALSLDENADELNSSNGARVPSFLQAVDAAFSDLKSLVDGDLGQLTRWLWININLDKIH